MALSLALICPSCRGPLEMSAAAEFICPVEGFRFTQSEGIWRFLLPERAAFYADFLQDYQTIRQAEGRGSHDATYYRALPYQDLSHRMDADWRIRAASFDALLLRVVDPLEKRQPRLRILDIGAGNGWLSNRLAERGHEVWAVDLLTNDFDGLACARFYPNRFTPLQADFNQLPLPDCSVDLVVFNASLHYSVDTSKTLAEALRVLAPGGRIVILDSPVYRNAASGAQMVKEREQAFLERFGLRSNRLPSQNYLTYASLVGLGENLGIRWRLLTPFYGLRWLLKPLAAKLRGRREPAKFHLIIGVRCQRQSDNEHRKN